MKDRSGLKRGFSLAFLLFSAACTVGYVLFIWANRSSFTGLTDPLITLISPVSLSVIAFVLSYRKPENAVSWVLVLVGFLLQTVYLERIVQTFFHRGTEPTVLLLVLANSWSFLSGLISTIMAYVFVIFPTGRLLSPRWRLVAGLLALQAAVSIGRAIYLVKDLAHAFDLARQGLLEITLTALTETGPTSTALHYRQVPEQGQVSLVIAAIALAVVLFGLASQVIRYRIGTRVEKQQIKWLILALFIWAGAIVLVLGPPKAPVVLFAIVFPLISASIAVAILRYRLYDIDILINRALVYGLLSACLAVLYFGSVLLLQLLFQRFSAGQSSLAIVASTLLIAVAFAPLRRRLQDFIDRRFYRQKYNAAEALNRFAALTRSEVDLDVMTETLLSVVNTSLQPRVATLWLKDG